MGPSSKWARPVMQSVGSKKTKKTKKQKQTRTKKLSKVHLQLGLDDSYFQVCCWCCRKFDKRCLPKIRDFALHASSYVIRRPSEGGKWLLWVTFHHPSRSHYYRDNYIHGFKHLLYIHKNVFKARKNKQSYTSQSWYLRLSSMYMYEVICKRLKTWLWVVVSRLAALDEIDLGVSLLI